MKKLILAIILIVSISFADYTVYRTVHTGHKIQTAVQFFVSETIYIPGKKPLVFKNQTITPPETAAGLLNKTVGAQTKGKGENTYVIAIGNVTADPSKKQYWAFYINGKLAIIGAGSYQLRPNDHIEWKIETY